MSCVFVVGGAGYIGSQMTADLMAAGYRPIVLDNFSTGNRDIAARVGAEVLEGDIGDRAFLARAFAQYSPSAVMHFAAFALVGESVTAPARYYRNNVAATLTLLEEMVAHGVLRFIFSSTCATYGLPEQVPITEDCPQRPINPYGQSKLMVEQMLRDFDRAYGMKSVAFRYFNAAGAHPTLAIGERHDPETHLIPRAIHAAYGRGALEIFGDDYATPDGTCVRDYIHVADIAQAHLLGLRFLEQERRSEAFNIGTGRGFSVREVIAAVEGVTGRRVPYTISPRRAGDAPRLVASAEKVRKILRWEPRTSELLAIVQSAEAWQRQSE